MRRRGWAFAAAVVAVIAGGLWWRGASSDAASTSAAPAVDAAAGVAPSQAAAGALPSSASAAGRADSLRGTQVDGGVRLDANGQPIADRDLRRLFDYFLTRLGEQSPEAIRAAVLAHVSSGFAPAVAAKVMAWFDAYVALERDTVEIGKRYRDLEEATQQVRALRRERLGAALAEAWYGDEERYLDYTLARQKLQRDRTLSEAERQRRLSELDQRLTPDRLALRDESEALDAAVSQSRQFEERHTDAATRYAEREATFGREAAQRLGELDARKAQWRDRLRTYAAQRQRVLEDGSLNDAQRQQRLDALLQPFDANERRRVDALTRNGMLPVN